jgi:uncharacterized membrane protein
MGTNEQWNDQRMEGIIGNLLRAGVIFSATLVIAGAVVYLARHGGERVDRGIFRGEPADLRSMGGILRDAFALRGRGIIQLGLLVLIATPVARVAFSVFAFYREGDRLYVVVTLVVLAVLLYSLGLGAV